MIDVDLARNPRTAPLDVLAVATPGFWRMEVRTLQRRVTARRSTTGCLPAQYQSAWF
ncbi:hypothetical protein [Nocardia sp. NBC_01009]|uniref:hypothetical protein n=1 Tax=Nocardia sp. NBC_01009 TaxID=2975996 RepID=UPI00386C5B30|nr:hypothetical protein OHA42_29210 [Nocardia sp. NBC_01009]